MNNDIKEGLLNRLNAIIDPDLNISLKDLNAIKKADFNDSVINLEIELFPPLYLVNPILEDKIKEICKGFDVNIQFIEKTIKNNPLKVLNNVKHIIAVASGKGGVGKSSVAANIASALSLTGAKVGLIDADIYGPSQPMMFGLQNEPFEAKELEDGTVLAIPNEKYNVKVASIGFVMNREEAAIVRGPLLANYFSLLFEQVDWSDTEFIVFDLPPGTGDVQLTLVRKIPLTGAVIVTTPQEISLADVRRSITMFNKVNVDILGVVENMSYFTPPDDKSKKYFIFGEGGGKKISEEQNVPFLGEVPIITAIRESCDRGLPTVLDGKLGPEAEIFKAITRKLIGLLRNSHYKNSLKFNNHQEGNAE